MSWSLLLPPSELSESWGEGILWNWDWSEAGGRRERGERPAPAPERMSVIMKPEERRGPVLLAIAWSSAGERLVAPWWRGLAEGDGVLGVTRRVSSSDMAGLQLAGYSEKSLFFGGIAVEILAVSTVMFCSLSVTDLAGDCGLTKWQYY